MYAARKGIKKGGNDMTYYTLIVRLQNDVRLKILETKNAQKIRKEVSHLTFNIMLIVYLYQLICVRKFLGLED